MLAVAGCEFRPDAVRVFNDSSRTIRLVEEFQGSKLDRGTLDPGTGFIAGRECVDADFVVLSLEDEELARRPGPFCQGEPEWVVTDEMLEGA